MPMGKQNNKIAIFHADLLSWFYSGGYASGNNTILIDNNAMENYLKAAQKTGSVSTLFLHEIGHLYESNYHSSHFNSELLANLLEYYFIDTTNIKYTYAGEDYLDKEFGKNDFEKELMQINADEFNLTQERYIFSAALFNFTKIKNDVGWEPIWSCFRELKDNNYSRSNLQKFNRFIECLEKNTKIYNIKENYFTVRELDLFTTGLN